MRYEINPKTYLTPKIVSFDTEYTDLNLRKAKLLSISIGISPDLTYIFNASYYEELDKVAKILGSAEIILTWNMVVDWYMITKSGFSIDKDMFVDAMLLEHLVDETLNHGLGDFALREYNDGYKKEFWNKYSRYQDAPREETYDYEMRDGCYTYRAGTKYLAALQERMDLVKHVHRLQWVLFDTEIKGIKVNEELIRKTKSDMSNKIDQYLPRLREAFSSECNVWELRKWSTEIAKRSSSKGQRAVSRPTFSFASDKQLSYLIYEALECPITEKTKKGSPKTDVETLKKISQECPAVHLIAEYKETKSVYSTFVEGMLDRVDAGRIYPRFNVNGTSTGRISHSNPNMGNLPTEGVFRNFFIPDTDSAILGADYAQLEVVVEANLTEDPSLLKIILEGKSKHDITAEGLGISRDLAKTVNFALQYGAGVFKLSKVLGVSQLQAQKAFDQYWVIYSGVKYLKDATSKKLRETRQITNLFGRTRHFPSPKNEFEASKQERQAYNFLIQGVGADITNMATYLIAEELKSKHLGRLLFSVHDEIVTEVKESLLDEAKSVIVNSMRRPNEYLNLKYPVDLKLYGPLRCWSKG